ncbi:CHASE3 domain-containing protein [Roseateles amylovorans]|uniref:CHASE3 domain-containing protein n=1 Tax=Roseateles amylovorans TaxID=2978473 RepID=A0ABY6AYE3_9BURK|nr:CHASE3 domain-containing protein [Roseateles amylovorans]UXH77702.1 CHASE3 domain-containing protein [Roseateles amylovorans]
MRLLTFPVAAALLLAGCVAFVVTAYSEYRSLGELTRQENVRADALRTQVLIGRVYNLLVDLETGQRGFLMTGDVSFLDPYEHAVRELDSRYAELKRTLAATGDAQSQAFGRLDVFIADRRVQVEQNIESRWRLGEAALSNLQGWVAGKQLMDEIRGEMERLDSLQQKRITDIERAVAQQQERTRLLAQILPLVGGVMVAAAMAALWVERQRRDVAERALRESHAQLETAVQERTRELTGALDRIQSFAAELDRSVEAERRRLAREVHDQLGQLGTAGKMLVLSLGRKMAPAKEALLDEMLTIADEVIGAARRIASSLRPPLLDDFGFAAAVQHYVQGLERQSGLVVVVDLASDERLSSEQHNQLFRLLQEAATNVLRHAQAQHLTIESRLEEGEYRLRIEDDGIGPGPVRVDASGLRNMRERAVLAGGRMDFGPAPQGGTRIDVSVPLQPGDTDDTSTGLAHAGIEKEEGWDEVSDR